MSRWPLPVLLVAGGLALLLAAVLVLGVRRLRLVRGGGSFDCSVRTPALREGRWVSGVARYGPGELRWYRVFALSGRPALVWQRTSITVQEFRPPERGEVFAVLPGAIVVTCDVDGTRLQLAIGGDSYTGFASWVEAAPPGQHARVT